MPTKVWNNNDYKCRHIHNEAKALNEINGKMVAQLLNKKIRTSWPWYYQILKVDTKGKIGSTYIENEVLKTNKK